MWEKEIKTDGLCGAMSERFKSLKISAESYKVLEQIRTLEFYRAVMLKDLVDVAWPRCPACGGPLIRKIASAGVFCASCRKEYALHPTS